MAQAIEAAVAAHTVTFPTPTPSVAQVSSDINALVLAQNDAHARTKGAVATRDAKLEIVITDLGQWRAYVESVANADPANALAIISSAGMETRKSHAPLKKNAVNVKKATASGSVVVTAKVGTKQKQSHEWEYSIDGGKTYVALTPTTQAKTTITGLTPGVTVLVRHRAITAAGPSAWTDPASMMVL